MAISQVPFVDATQKLAKGWRLPTIPAWKQRMERKRVHIINVGPWQHEVSAGSLGTFRIPACPVGKDYVEMKKVLYEDLSEVYPVQTGQYRNIEYDGRETAQRMIGAMGKLAHTSASLVPMGVFVAAGEVPTEEEILEARNKLNQHCETLLNYIRGEWDSNPGRARRIKNPQVYDKAARVLGVVNEPWQSQSAPAASIKCPWCGVYVPSDAAVCHNCKNVVNEDNYAALKAKTRKPSLNDRLLAAQQQVQQVAPKEEE